MRKIVASSYWWIHDCVTSCTARATEAAKSKYFNRPAYHDWPSLMQQAFWGGSRWLKACIWPPFDYGDLAIIWHTVVFTFALRIIWIQLQNLPNFQHTRRCSSISRKLPVHFLSINTFLLVVSRLWYQNSNSNDRRRNYSSIDCWSFSTEFLRASVMQ